MTIADIIKNHFIDFFFGQLCLVLLYGHGDLQKNTKSEEMTHRMILYILNKNVQFVKLIKDRTEESLS